MIKETQNNPELEVKIVKSGDGVMLINYKEK